LIEWLLRIISVEAACRLTIKEKRKKRNVNKDEKEMFCVSSIDVAPSQ